MRTYSDIVEQVQPRTTHQILDCIQTFFNEAGHSAFVIQDGRLQLNVPVTLADNSIKTYGVFVWAKEFTPGFNFRTAALDSETLYTEDLSRIPELVRLQVNYVLQLRQLRQGIIGE